MRARARAESAGPTPLLIKIAPDLTLGELDDVVGVARRHRIDGMIVGNTTISAAAALREQREGEGAGRAVGPSAVRARRPACWPRPMCAPKARSR